MAKVRKLIYGDNIKVLKILEDEYKERIKCIYIDPPYNNKETYNHYIDNLDHKEWADNKLAILQELLKFLTDDGSIWISIDDNEVHYLKVLADKVFNRKNFVSTIIWEHRKSRENRAVFSNNHEYILVYAKNIEKFKRSRNMLPPSEEQLNRYKNLDDDPRGPWQSVSANVQDGHATESQYYEIIAPNGRKHYPPNGRCWVYNKDRMLEEIKNNNIWFGKDGNGVPRIKSFLKDKKNLGLTPETLWKSDFAGTSEEAKKSLLELFPDEMVFDTPKPERLLERIIEIATNPGDIVLDAYLGSGTTTAVCHKMDRGYIGIENGSQFEDIILPRMDYVVEEYGYDYQVIRL